MPLPMLLAKGLDTANHVAVSGPPESKPVIKQRRLLIAPRMLVTHT